MSEVEITELEPDQFGVQVREGETTTSHRVQVPRTYLDAIGLGDADAGEVVRESFAFLLEREPGTSILRQFALSDITRFFPDYPDELRRRLSR